MAQPAEYKEGGQSHSVRVFDLKEVFPFSKFTDLPRSEKKRYCLHFYITHGGSNRNHAFSMLEKDVSLLSQEDPQYRLTPFAVAVIQNDEEIAEALKNKGAEIECRDHQGWAPLHYAVLEGNVRMQQLLREWGHSDEVFTNSQATPQQCADRLCSQDIEDDAKVFAYRDPDTQEILEGTAAKFQELTGARFTAEMITTPKGLFKEWCCSQRGNEVSPFWLKFLELAVSKYELFRQNPPRLYLDLSCTVGYGVFAREVIPKGSFVELYLGMKKGGEPEDVSYYIPDADIDGKECRNLGPMMNDGFPNVIPINIQNIDGFTELQGFIAIEDISENEEIFWDYGESHTLVKQHHSEARTDQIVQWIQSLYEGESLLIPGEPQGNNLEEYLKHFSFIRKVHYLYNTPKTTIRLLLNSQLDPDLLFTLSEVVPLPDDSDFARVLQQTVGFIKFLKLDSEQVRTQICEFLLDCLDQRPFLTVFPVLAYYVDQKVKKLDPPDNWLDIFHKFLNASACLENITEKRQGDKEDFENFKNAVDQVPERYREQYIAQTSDYLENYWPEKLDLFVEVFS